MFMRPTIYGEVNPRHRFKDPCKRLSRNNLQTTYHSPYQDEGKVSLSSYLGLDKRGVRALNKLRRNVTKHSIDEYGYPSESARGILGGNIPGRQIDHEPTGDERILFA